MSKKSPFEVLSPIKVGGTVVRSGTVELSEVEARHAGSAVRPTTPAESKPPKETTAERKAREKVEAEAKVAADAAAAAGNADGKTQDEAGK